jgi:hypothetical protein
VRRAAAELERAGIVQSPVARVSVAPVASLELPS